MACGSGCCGPSAAAAAEETSAESAPVIQAPRQEDEDSCGGDVSSVVDRDPDQPRFAGLARDELAEMDDKSRLIVSTPGQGARCDKLTVGPQDGAGCEVRNVGLEHDTEPSCSKGCCSAPEPPRSDDTGVPSCCEGKAAPCCDQSCLDRLALRECEIPQPALSESHGKLAGGLPRSMRNANLRQFAKVQPVPNRSLAAAEARTAGHAPTTPAKYARCTRRNSKLSAASAAP